MNETEGISCTDDACTGQLKWLDGTPFHFNSPGVTKILSWSGYGCFTGTSAGRLERRESCHLKLRYVCKYSGRCLHLIITL